MATLDDICRVDIALNTAVVSRATFGVPLVYGPAQFSGNVRTYSAMPKKGDDGLSQEVYDALGDLFSQTPSPSRVKVGKASFDSFKAIYEKLTVGDVLTITDENTNISYSTTVAQGQLIDEVMSDLSDTINADADNKVISAVTAPGVITLTYASQTDRHKFKAVGPLTIGGYVMGKTNVAAELDAIYSEDPGFYGVVSTARDADVQMEIAEWVESHKRLYGLSTKDVASIDPASTTDVIARLKDKQYFRTFPSYHSLADSEYPEAAWMGVCFTMAPGSETWALKRLAGITPNKMSETARNAVFAKNGNTFEYYSSNIALTNNGKTSAGEWIDIIRGRDWLSDLIQTNMAQLMINVKKIPYDDAGINMCAMNLIKSLKTGVDVGFLAQEALDSSGAVIASYMVQIPRAADISDVEKGSRILTLPFKARVAGAIHATNISGSVSYSFNQ